MNIRKALMISFISFAFLVTGCSSKGIDSVQQIADEATCQKTMTKVQNNVNEIIGKDYKYEMCIRDSYSSTQRYRFLY